MRPPLVSALLCMGLFVSCTAPPRASGGVQLSAEARIQAIPPADPAKAGSAKVNNWQNPYLAIRENGIALVDFGNNEERILKGDQVLDALAALPSSAWPYGRVVAVEETDRGTPEQRVEVRRNRAVVAGTLESAHVLIHWIPPTP
ncbi:MAG TPA: hypothetical protein VFA89_10050 [Terriglobales bacterium]|nr:hypothetical protein [Terriglobales bacterium]